MNSEVILYALLFAFLQANFDIAAARAVRSVQPLAPDEEECVLELNLNEEQITIINSQDITPENDTAYNAFLGCYWQKLQWQDKDGEIIYDNIKEWLQEMIASEFDSESPAVVSLIRQMVASSVEDCKKNPPPRGKNHGQTAVKVQNCIMRNFTEMLY